MPHKIWIYGGLWLALIAFGACVYPAIEYKEVQSTTSSDSGGATGTGGEDASTTTSATGSGGAGGGAQACDLYSTGQCGAGKKCTIIDTKTGAVGCAEAGPRPAFAFCEVDVECSEGTWCDERTFTCHTLCQNGNPCAVGALCVQGYRVDTDDNLVAISDLGLCTAHCDPKTASACNSDFGPPNGGVTCINIGVDFDCVVSNGQNEGQSCTWSNDCSIGLRCSGDPGVCTSWCKVGMDLCNGAGCCSLDPKVSYNGAEYGVCC